MSIANKNPKILDEVMSFRSDVDHRKELQRAIDLIEAGSILVVVGAGMSEAAGLATFRGPRGCYTKETERDLRTHTFQNPHTRGRFFMFLENVVSNPEIQPTNCHLFLKRLIDNRKIIRIYTQNIDCLEKEAGIPDSLVVQCHGSVETGSCRSPDCGEKYDAPFMIEAMKVMRSNIIDEHSAIVCTKCNSTMVRHDVVLYDEAIKISNSTFHADVELASVLLVIGTSLTVNPIGNWVGKFKSPVIIIDECARALAPPPPLPSVRHPVSQKEIVMFLHFLRLRGYPVNRL
jgi:NAD-dependent SIR2 family protein deacetylase